MSLSLSLLTFPRLSLSGYRGAALLVGERVAFFVPFPGFRRGGGSGAEGFYWLEVGLCLWVLFLLLLKGIHLFFGVIGACCGWCMITFSDMGLFIKCHAIFDFFDFSSKVTSRSGFCEL